MVTLYGMSDTFGVMALSNVSNQYLDGQAYMNCSEATSAAVDTEVKKLLETSFEDAKRLLREHRSLLDDVALYLLQKETITGDELMAYVNADKKQLEQKGSEDIEEDISDGDTQQPAGE